MRSIFFIFLFLGASLFGLAQITPPIVADTTITNNKDELIVENQGLEVKEIDTYSSKFVPRKASLYAAIFPGMGQVYNKKYWKVPIVYGGFIALGFTIDFFNDQNRVHRRELFDLLDSDPSGRSPRGLTVTQLRSLEQDTRRERDFYIIMTGVLYLLQIADAHIDAHLKEFDLNPELKVSIEPMLDQSEFANYSAGISLKLKF